tara:strand:+ start:2492 stop:3286 length:795 start_codon:yes stop_codon:yes gene_type:complete
MKDYYQIDALSASLLKTVIKQSPAHAEHRMKNFEATANMKLGTAFHAAILENDQYEDLIAISPKVDRRTKAGKEEHANFVESVGDRTIITHDQSILVDAMQKNCLAHPEVRSLLNKCYAYEFQTEFEFDGVNCKAMIDACDDMGTIVDLKTTQDASPDAFMKSSANFLYHMQMAWYSHAMGVHWSEANAYIIAVENTQPHGVAVYKMTTDSLRVGWELCCQAVKEYKHYKVQCALDEELFLPYGSNVKNLDLPIWAKNGVEEYV